ncbi:DMT family transporter [Novosphingobium sp. 1949]|uniref:DMT family transporter n=1 Tax=Novosphingobium organovorum TaxID=2930092 RepID=A0ABT0BDK9_9SPHN|nr:DMT family transporter [Novosphingobium organovorum]MCJ2183068.1 DMT family transporter [Novosphingobium organovorum]
MNTAIRSSSAYTRAFLLLGLVMLLWAGNSIVGRAVRADIPPFTLAFGRWLIAVAVLAPFAWPRLRAQWSEVRGGWGWLLVLGLLGVVCFNSFVYSGLHYTTAANALLLQASIPALVLAFDVLLFRGRPARLQVIGVVCSTLGVAFIVFRGAWQAVMALQIGGVGDALILCGSLSWSLYTVLLRKKPPVDPAVFLLLTFGLGALALAPMALWEHAQGLGVHWSGTVLGAFVYVGVFPSVLAYFIYIAATFQLGPARAGQAITLMPLFGALLSALLLGERLAAYHAMGMALILAGIVLSALALRGRRPPTPAA